jgi:crotonobetainyl-CoA:carnitine CoA-transferase CaiB-like acyl-CoA transferase
MVTQGASAPSSNAADRPLAGVRVLDLSRVLAGPYVGRMLADLGADVVKLEPPEGDVTRNWGHKRHGLSGYYTQQNVGKRNVCVDLRAAGGSALVERLATSADVLVENFRPGVLDQFGLGWRALSAKNPRLVMLSISGFGQDGPESRRPAYATVVHAESGIAHRQALLDGTPPVDPRVSIADMDAALHGLVGVLSALVMRQRTGRGQHVDIGMLDSVLATDDYVHLALDGMPAEEGIIVNETWNVVGGPILIAGGFRWTWKRLNEVHGVQDGVADGAPLDEKIRARREAIGRFFATFDDRGKLLAALDHADLAWGDVRSTERALQSLTAVARAAVVEVDDRGGGSRRVIQSPYRFSDATSGARGGAPRRGEHNHEVLGEWLALGVPEIDALAHRGVLLTER